MWGEHNLVHNKGSPPGIDSETQNPSVLWLDHLQQELRRFLWLGQAGERKKNREYKTLTGFVGPA